MRVRAYGIVGWLLLLLGCGQIDYERVITRFETEPPPEQPGREPSDPTDPPNGEDGVLQFSQFAYSTTAGTLWLRDMAVDSQGRPYLLVYGDSDVPSTFLGVDFDIDDGALLIALDVDMTLRWARTCTGQTTFDFCDGFSLAMKDGVVAVGGTYDGPVLWEGGTPFVDQDEDGPFVARYTTDGTFVSARGFDGPANGYGVLLREGGELLFGIQRHGAVDFGLGPISYGCCSDEHTRLRLDNSNTPIAQEAQSHAVPTDYVAAGARVYASGRRGSGPQDEFVMTLTATEDGTSQVWAFTGAGERDGSRRYDNQIALGVEGDLLVAGKFGGLLNFGDLETPGDFDGVLGVFRDAGTSEALRWAKAIGGPADDDVTTLTATADGRYVAFGNMVGEIDVDGVGASLGAGAGLFVATFTSEGTVLSVEAFPATDAAFKAAELAPDGSIWVAGHFRDYIDLGQDPVFSRYQVPFVVRLQL